ncbi:hypothetical protein [Tersicoccus sp. Bi-70]|uniref:hypothetical protein n=1 Tax=Tersicoccus sp. Bi-70 TaxID=1897634 RepID=UPI000975E12A|nr:hypothetical protein [Tersicoccus sp. Bi-70]OMH31146.1 hypothetical protein BGP79_08725 [Tersicoccus sp. Bi-70]
MNRKFSITITGLALAATLGLAGCGGSSSTSTSSAAASGGASSAQAAEASSPSATPTPETPTATVLYPKMKAAVKAATSAHVKATDVSGSKETYEVTGNQAGTNATLSIASPTKGKAQVLIVGTKGYLKGDATYWKAVGAPTAAASKLIGKWVAVPAAKMSSLGEVGIKNIADSTFKNDPTSAQLAKGTVTAADLDGVKAWKITGFDGTSASSLWVAADGEPYPLRVANTKASTGTRTTEDVRFDQWNSAPKAVAPAASEIVAAPGQG